MPQKPYTSQIRAATTTEAEYELSVPSTTEGNGRNHTRQKVAETEWEVAHLGVDTSGAAATSDVQLGWDATFGTDYSAGTDKDIIKFGDSPLPIPPGTLSVFVSTPAAASDEPLIALRPVSRAGTI